MRFEFRFVIIRVCSTSAAQVAQNPMHLSIAVHQFSGRVNVLLRFRFGIWISLPGARPLCSRLSSRRAALVRPDARGRGGNRASTRPAARNRENKSSAEKRRKQKSAQQKRKRPAGKQSRNANYESRSSIRLRTQRVNGRRAAVERPERPTERKAARSD